jgi:hypothetical protein
VKPKTVYLLLCFLGLALPYWEFVPWLAQNGLNLPLFFAELFANRISAFFGADVLVSAIVVVRFIRVESARADVRLWWLPIVALLTVGVSLALPLFLYLREGGQTERFRIS